MGKAGKSLKNTPKDKIPAAKIAGKQKPSQLTVQANANSVKAMQSEQDLIVPSFQEGACKFSNSLIASTSDKCDTIFVWEPSTLAPLETFAAEKFFIHSNTLQVDAQGYLVGTHVQKTMMAAWRWDKTREPCIRSPLKEELTVLKMFGSSQRDDQMLACATKKGKILVY
jgi:hypothetical protein